MRESSGKVFEFTIVYNRLKRQVYNYASKMINDKNVCEDIVQSVFVKFYENMERIVNKDSYNFWIFRTARNEIFGYYRNKKKFFSGDDPHDEEEVKLTSGRQADEILESKELKQILNNQLSNLPDEQKEVFILKEFSGLSYREIASVMNISEDLVKSRLYKVRQKLVKKMADYVL